MDAVVTDPALRVMTVGDAVEAGACLSGVSQVVIDRLGGRTCVEVGELRDALTASEREAVGLDGYGYGGYGDGDGDGDGGYGGDGDGGGDGYGD